MNEGLPLSEIFPSTYHFMTKQLDHNDDTFHLIVSSKCPQPFESLSGLQYALDLKQPPSKSDFFSRLIGHHLDSTDGISEQDYEKFLNIFKALKCSLLWRISHAAYAQQSCNSCLSLDMLSHLYVRPPVEPWRGRRKADNPI